MGAPFYATRMRSWSWRHLLYLSPIFINVLALSLFPKRLLGLSKCKDLCRSLQNVLDVWVGPGGQDHSISKILATSRFMTDCKYFLLFFGLFPSLLIYLFTRESALISPMLR